MAMGLCGAGVVGAAAPVDPCILKVRWEQRPPYGVRLPDGRRSGYYAEAMREAARRVGCRVDLIEMPWARGLRELEAGRIDIVPGALRTPERKRFAYFTRPIELSPNLLFLRAGAARRWPLRNLAMLADTPLRIGAEAGAVYSEEYGRLLREPAFAARLRPIPDQPRGWRMLREGRLDGILSDQASALVEELGPVGAETVTPVLIVSARPSVALVGRHVDAAFLARLDRAFDAMIDEGWLPQLREAWIPCTVDPATMGCRTGERIEAPPPPRGAAGRRDAGDLSPPSR